MKNTARHIETEEWVTAEHDGMVEWPVTSNREQVCSILRVTALRVF